MNYLIKEFNVLGDTNGRLIAIESSKHIPFDIKRIFYIYGTQPNVIRGQHANRNSEFVLINVAGSCKVKLFDGQNEEIVVLDKPNIGLYIPKMIWKDMYDFSENAVLLVLSNCVYDPNEYIRDINDYKLIMENVCMGGVQQIKN